MYLCPETATRTKKEFAGQKRKMCVTQTTFQTLTLTELHIWTKSCSEKRNAHSNRHTHTRKHFRASLGHKCTGSCLQGLAGPGRATHGGHVSKNTQKAAKRRAEHGPIQYMCQTGCQEISSISSLGVQIHTWNNVYTHICTTKRGTH